MNEREKDTKEAKRIEARTYDVINNIALIEDALRHLELELLRDFSMYHRVAKEAYSVLYKSMIEALRGSANLEVKGEESKEAVHIYELGRGPLKKIKKVEVPGCIEFWRYSEPEEYLTSEQSERKKSKHKKNRTGENYLIKFDVALARIQTELYMETMAHSKKCTVSDYDMRVLEILHSAIRNEFEHFMPKARLTSIDDLLYMSKLCLELAKELLFESRTVTFYDGNQQDIRDRIDNNLTKINQIVSKRTKVELGNLQKK